MVPDLVMKLECPKCRLPIEAKIKRGYREFLIYICPGCQNNIVYYNNTIDVISDKLLRKLIKQKRLKTCGQIKVEASKSRGKVISLEDVTDLKISLETSQSVDEFLSKL